jgi:hypothetical protein
MANALHVLIETFFITTGVFAVWAIATTLRETFGGK